MAKDCINAPILSDDGRKEKFDELANKMSGLQKEHTELQETITDKKQRATKFRQFYKQLEMQESFITEFDAMMFASLVDHITVYPDGHLSFTFRDNKEI